MKASVKFREDQKPLFRAKVPLSILGLPFQSGIVAGESKEFALNLGTFFESGPSVKIAYRPNDSWNPFSVVVKTGAGHFGSPAASSMAMSAEFSLLGARANPNPRFMLHFKPQFGDFSAKKSVSSSVLDGLAAKPFNGAASEDEVEVVDSPVAVKVLSAGAIAKVFSGTEVAARTSVPVTNHAAVSFRWGVRVPTEMKASAGFNPAAGISFQKIPFLAMNKIGIEHVEAPNQKSISDSTSGPCPPRNADLAEACFLVKHQLEVLHAENGMLKKAVDDLRREFAGASASQSSFDRSLISNNTKSDRRSNEKKSAEVIGVSDSKGISMV